MNESVQRVLSLGQGTPNFRKVAALLVSMNDYLPTPQAPRFYKSGAVGPQASAYKECSLCKGCGRMDSRTDMPCPICGPIWKQEKRRLRRARHGCRMCLLCDGQGEVRAALAERNFDRYTGLPMSELEQAISAAKEEELRGRHKRDLRVGEVEAGDEGDVFWVEERTRYYMAGDYELLSAALHKLRDRYPLQYEMLMHWVAASDAGVWWSWSKEAERGVCRTIAWVAGELPDDVRVPSWVMRRFSARRAA